MLGTASSARPENDKCNTIARLYGGSGPPVATVCASRQDRHYVERQPALLRALPY